MCIFHVASVASWFNCPFIHSFMALMVCVICYFTGCYLQCSGLLLSLKDDTTPMETDEHNESIIDSQPVDIALPNCDHDSIINEGNTHYMY